MPIKPENRHRYPKDWKQVRHRILQRANWRCEHPNCRARHGVTGYWRKGLFHRLPDVLWDAGYTAGDVVACDDGLQLKLIQIVLTIAHLDHQPESCAPDNLRAWCQRCHNAYDAPMRRAGIRSRAKAQMAAGDMFGAAK